jgi:hypothetical protein
LKLVRDIGVPAGVVDAVVTQIFSEEVVCGISVHDMELWIALDITRRRVALDGTKVTSDLDLALGTKVLEVLVTEDEYLALSSEKGELV